MRRRLQKKVREVEYASFSTNDGMSLRHASNKSVDFVFSFDSSVHATAEVMSAYVAEILRVLNVNGVAFIHHSNWLEVGGRVQNEHGRGPGVSADFVQQAVVQARGTVLIQEKINWGYKECTDCLSLFAYNGQSEPVLIENHDFMLEGNNIRKYQSPYARIAVRSGTR